MDIFNPTFNEQYKLARRLGDRRFGSECKHEKVADGRCLECQRKIVVSSPVVKMAVLRDTLTVSVICAVCWVLQVRSHYHVGT